MTLLQAFDPLNVVRAQFLLARILSVIHRQSDSGVGGLAGNDRLAVFVKGGKIPPFRSSRGNPC